jgi:two-component system phosphate regulon response regulator PhoB
MSAQLMKERILLVDDEPDIVELLEYNLRQAGFTVVTVKDGTTALYEIRRQRPDLILLDVMLPDMSGTDIVKRLRKEPATESIPVILVTALGAEIDRVVGLEVGADDYVVKPFSPREVILRINAILRRTSGAGPEPKAAEPELLTIGVLAIDMPHHRVTVEGEEVSLTTIEFKLLYDLACRAGRVQSRENLLERVWGYAPGVETRTVDTHVKRLREKLGAARDHIETLRGWGYRMNLKPGPRSGS